MSDWLELARQMEAELAQQPPEVQKAIRQMSKRQYRQPEVEAAAQDLLEEFQANGPSTAEFMARLERLAELLGCV